MSTLCAALDSKMTNLQMGENMNEEYGWSKNIEELLVQFNFQLTRTQNMKELEDKYQELLNKIFVKNPDLKYVKIIYKLIGYTRDIISGKGEYNLTYMLISGLYKFSQSVNCEKNDKYKIQAMSLSAIESLIRVEVNEHPYGSWKDLKYFCNYHIEEKNRYNYNLNENTDILFNKVIELICAQISCDEKSPKKTLAAKWIPREKSSKFGWITPILAMNYYKPWMKDTSLKNIYLTPDSSQYKLARRKCLTHFRQLIAKINKELNTPQINQCNAKWSEIDFNKDVTSITLRKQSKAFQSIKKNGEQRINLFKNEDRLQCAKNYKKYVEDCKLGKVETKGKRVSLIDYVRDALNTNIITMNEEEQIEKDSINTQWINNGKQNKVLENCIAMIDTSGSMECDDNVPLYSALGLGIRIAEKSKLGKRLLTFSANPTWINLEEYNDFVSMVHMVRKAPWGMNTNFRAALDLILDTAISNNINPEDMKNMSLIILSDMQIDQSQNKNEKNEPMLEMMKQKYYDAGLRTIYNTPYEVPHIIFWNLRSTSGFPSLSSNENVSMMSGNSPALLNAFCNNGVNELKEITPWKMLLKELSNKRYNYLENIVDNNWNYNNIMK